MKTFKETVMIWQILLLFIIALNTMGCRQILIMHFQIKDPRIENSISLEKYIEKKKMEDDIHYTLTYEGYINTINSVGFPGIQIYNRDGAFLSFTDSESCTGSASEFIKTLKEPNNFTVSFPTNDSLKLNHVIKELRTIKGDTLNYNAKLDIDTDYIIVMYWAKFVGKLNKRDLNKWKESIAKNQHSTFETIMVNCDFQEWWNEEDLSKFGLTK